MPLLRKLLLLLGLVCISTAALAQGAFQANLTPPNTEQFPLISSYLYVHNESGIFVSGLEAHQLTVLEDGREIDLETLSLQQPGVQFVLALNPDPSFAIRDANGRSRFDYVLQALNEWGASRLGSTLDDLSFLTPDGPQVSHLNDPQAWLNAISAYEPKLREASPQLHVFSRAMEVASDTPPRPGMGRVLLLVTPLLPPESSMGLQTLMALAKQADVHIYVWLVTSPTNLTSPAITQLSELAIQTGGSMFSFTGSETLPSLKNYLEPHRYTYFLTYTSRLTSSGMHELAIKVHSPGWEVTTPPVTFGLDVQPPNPAFVSLPTEIVRTSPDKNLQAQFNPENFQPQQYFIDALINFPDGHPRPLVHAILYVDGTPTVYITEPPFDRLAWDLQSYTTTGEHIIWLEVEDTLGLKGISIEVPITIIVEQPSQGLLTTLYVRAPALAAIFIAIAVAGTLLALILTEKVRPRLLGARKIKLRISLRKIRTFQLSKPAQTRIPNWVQRLHWTRRHPGQMIYAHLIPLDSDNQPTRAPSIPIIAREVTLGSDPQQAIVVLNHPSVAGLHARLQRQGEDTFYLMDAGTIAGTWINYQSISKEGLLLRHGDIIHFGLVGFRFRLTNPPELFKPVIIPLEEDEQVR
ncbi:MAG: FHA domain-containing protein [Chloroflexota bacterium]